MGVGDSSSTDFLKNLLDAADSAGRDVSSINRALVPPVIAGGRVST
jgi:hypothetical protein